MKTMILSATVLAIGLGLGANRASAEPWGNHERFLDRAPACPGPGYLWIPGEMRHGFWQTGRWEFRAERRAFDHFDEHRGRMNNQRDRGEHWRR